jgi:hypothetical protein
MIQDIHIDDDLAIQDHAAIEVTIQLSNGERRWCFFFTPKALSECGDIIEGTNIRYHYGASHMIVVSGLLTQEMISKVLLQIYEQGDLLTSTLQCAD